MANVLKSLTNSVKYWYIPLIAGIVFIICGAYIFTVPLATYVTLSVIFSMSFIISGLFDIFFSVQNSRILNGWGWYLVSGLISSAMGIYLLIYPGISITILPFVVGFTIMFRSFQLFGFSLDLKDVGIPGWGNLALISVLGIIFSFLLLANPFFAGLSLVTLTGLSFTFAGISAIVLAFNLRKIKYLPGKISNELKSKIESLQNEINKSIK